MDTIQPKWLILLQSRKFWAAIFGLVALAISYQFGHTSLEGVELKAVAIISAYILSVAIEDHGIALASRSAPVVTIPVVPMASAPLEAPAAEPTTPAVP